MKTLRSTFIILSIVALALIVTPVAMAGTLTYTTTEANANDNLANEVVTPVLLQFNNISGPYAGDVLNSVTITFVGTGITTLVATNSDTGNTSTNVQVQSTTTVHLDSSIGALDTLLVANNFKDSMSASVSGETVAPSTTDTYGSITMTSAGGKTLLFSSSLGLFQGTGDLGFELNSLTNVLGGGTGGSLTTGQENNGSGGIVTVTYDYGPPPSGIPEPGTLSLFGTGLLGLAGMLRHKFAK